MKNIIKNLANSLRNILPKEFLLKKYGLLAVGERLRPNFMTVTMDAVNSSDYNIIVSENFSYPFEENSLKVIYTSHNIEHYSDQVAIKFFQECYRVLRSGGEVLIEVPDAKLLYDKLKKYYDDGDMSILEIFNFFIISKNHLN
jgi:predicted SAM-dependent methyltransferase